MEPLLQKKRFPPQESLKPGATIQQKHRSTWSIIFKEASVLLQLRPDDPRLLLEIATNINTRTEYKLQEEFLGHSEVNIVVL